MNRKSWILIREMRVAKCRYPLMALSLLILAGCVGGNYQAPVMEQSEVLDQTPAIIVTSSDDIPTRYSGRASQSRTQARTQSVTTPAVHRVVAGESLYSIAYQYDLDYRQLAGLNGLQSPYTISAGQQLVLTAEADRSGSSAQGESAVAAGLGRVVPDNEVAQANAASVAGGGVTRQPITRTPITTGPATADTNTGRESAATRSTLPPPLPMGDPEWRWPIQGRVLTSFQADTSARKGIDIGGDPGQPVYAAASGDVVYAGNGIQGAGNLIIIRHSDRFLSAYAHNQRMLVTEGDRVGAGDQIGEVGRNGDGPALLHFEIRENGKPVDPLAYLPRR